MDLVHQRAGRIDDVQSAHPGDRVYLGRDTMRGKHERRTRGHLVGIADKCRTDSLQFGDHLSVVHNFVTYAYRCAVAHQREADRLDGPFHARAWPRRAVQSVLLANWRYGRIVDWFKRILCHCRTVAWLPHRSNLLASAHRSCETTLADYVI
jgi:hypothetical protein